MLKKIKIIVLFITISPLCYGGLAFFKHDATASYKKWSDPHHSGLQTSFLYTLSGPFSSKIFLHVSFGGELPMFQIKSKSKKELLCLQAMGNVRTRFDFYSESMDTYSIDYVGGINVIVPWGLFSKGQWELFLNHYSSHMGDEYLLSDGRKYDRINYSRETLVISYIVPFTPFLLNAFSSHFILRKTEGKSSFFILQYNLQTPFEKIGMFGFDIKFREEMGFVPDINLQATIYLGEQKKFKMKQVLSLEYYNGCSIFGQFFKDREQYFSLGLQATL